MRAGKADTTLEPDRETDQGVVGNGDDGANSQPGHRSTTPHHRMPEDRAPAPSYPTATTRIEGKIAFLPSQRRRQGAATPSKPTVI
ncbi:hypothetical protein ACWD4B_12165 [Streptomyces sp. NPDC002536]